jgi:hypothetical protein
MPHILVIGITESGKSTFIRDVLIPQLKYFVIFDIEQQDNLETRCDIVTSSYRELINAINTKKKICYQSKAIGSEAIIKDFGNVAKILFETTNYYFICDEVSDVCSPNFIGDYHFNLIRKGAKRGLFCISASQRPSLCNRLIYTQSKIKICFCIDDYDILAMKPYCPPIEKVKSLQPYEYLYYDGKRDFIQKSIKL